MSASSEASMSLVSLYDLVEDDAEVFAILRPTNLSARKAYDGSVKLAIDDADKFAYVNRTVLADPGYDAAGGNLQEDEGITEWGYFKLSLSVPPHNPEEGWYLGTSRGISEHGEIDVLLGPPTAASESMGLGPKHARIFMHRDTCKIVIEAKDAVKLGQDDTTIIQDSARRVLENGEMIQFGSCLYSFEITKYPREPAFENYVSAFMKKIHGTDWQLNVLICSGRYDVLGDYRHDPVFSPFDSPSHQAQPGYSRQGDLVALKVFNSTDRVRASLQRDIMGRLKYHGNVLHLLDSNIDEMIAALNPGDTQILGAYYVYTPVGTHDLAAVIEIYCANYAAQLALLGDFANGLSFMHEQNIVHGNVEPCSLSVVSFEQPRGVITDLAFATLASDRDERKRADVWDLAFCAVGLYQRRYAGSLDGSLRRHHRALHRTLDERHQASTRREEKAIMTFIKRMTPYDPADQVSASDVRRQVERFRTRAHLGRGRIGLAVLMGEL